MADTLDPSMDDEVWNAIQACEQILEAIPNDRHALRTLSNAYEQIGDAVQARDYALRLGEVLVAENDVEAAAEHRERLLPYADDAEMQTMMQRLDEMAPVDVEMEEAPAGAATPAPAAPAAAAHFDVTTEISLAWAMREAELFTEEQYSEIVEDLTRLSGDGSKTTVSVLHVLYSRGYKQLEKVIGVMARLFDCPVIDPRSFHMTHEMASLFPLDRMISHGVLPFERMGETVLVGLVNPQDAAVRKEVVTTLERPCHFYFVHPGSFDEVIATVKGMLDGSLKAEED